MMTSTKLLQVTLQTAIVIKLISLTLELKLKRVSINLITVGAMQSNLRHKEMIIPLKKCRKRRGSGEQHVTPHNRCAIREMT